MCRTSHNIQTFERIRKKMMNDITRFFATTASNKIMEIVVICIVMDTIFGVLRAIKEKKFNSNFGINGAIRKVGMLISLVLLALVDSIIRLNLIGFIPAGARTYLPGQTVGTMEFFALLYIAYEIVSILKNMSLCGLPVKKVWRTVKRRYQSIPMSFQWIRQIK